MSDDTAIYDYATELLTKPIDVLRKEAQDFEEWFLSSLSHKRLAELRPLYKLGHKSAKSRGFEWQISFADFAQLRELNCHYCDGPLPKSGHGLDRCNSKFGYFGWNVTQCCGPCNRRKGADWSMGQMEAATRAAKAAS